MTERGCARSGRLYRNLVALVALGVAQVSCSSEMGSTIDDEGSGGAASDDSLLGRRGRGRGGKGGAGGQGGTAGTGATAGTGGATGGTAGTAGSPGSGGGGSAGAGTVDAGTTIGGGAAALAAKLGKTNFMIGLGANGSAYPATSQLDIRYAYLVGNADVNSSWTKWNSPDGEFAAIVARNADAKGTIPMFNVYEFAASGDGNFGIVQDTALMTRFWADLQLLANKLKAFDKPAIVHLEPDFWGYAQSASPGNDPTKFAAKVKIAPTCGDLADDLTGLARCAFRIFHTTSPKAVVGLHASNWAAYDANGKPDGAAVGTFLATIAGGQADFVATDILDRDAGCFEAKPSAYDCGRGGTTGWYWDETNTTSPNYHEYLSWAKALHLGAGIPILWRAEHVAGRHSQ